MKKKVFIALPQPDSVVKYNIKETRENIELSVKFLLNNEDIEFISNDHAWVNVNNEVKHLDLFNTGNYAIELANCDMFVTLDTSWRYKSLSKLNLLAAQCPDIEILRLPTQYFAPELYVAPKRVSYSQYYNQNDDSPNPDEDENY